MALYFTACSGSEVLEPSTSESSQTSLSNISNTSSELVLSSNLEAISSINPSLAGSEALNSSSSLDELHYSSSTPIVSSSSKNKTGFLKFTFDDAYIDSWYAVKDSLIKYNIQATFFISGFSRLNNQEIDKLSELQELGFEIGHHSLNHIDATSFLQTNSTYDYYNKEIKPDLDKMLEKGFTINSFAYPFGKGVPSLDSLLLQKFRHIRYVAESQRGGRPKNIDIFNEGFSDILYPPISSGIGIDSNYSLSLELIYESLEKAKTTESTLTFYAHKIVLDNPEPYQVKLSTLISIAKEAKRLGLTTITFSNSNK